MDDVREAGFRERTRLAAARERLLAAIDPIDRTETLPVSSAIGRVLAEDVTARRAAPHYDRAAMDGYAVRARDTFGASGRSPAVLRAGTAVGPDTAVQVHTGSEVPAGADAVVRVEDVDRIERGGGDGESADEGAGAGAGGVELEVFDAVAEGENVAPAGEDVERGETVLDAGRRLRPTDPGLCKVVGASRVETAQRPTVGVVPTGEELVDADPAPGETVETNGLTVSTLVERWGGKPNYRDVVDDDRHALRAAIERDLTKDLVVTTGGTSVGERDLLPEVVDDLGEVLVHGVALKPGHPVGFGVVRETPVLMLPGYPVSAIVTAMQLLRPAVKRAGHLPEEPHPTVEARLDAKIASEVGVRTFERVRLDEPADRDGGEDEDDEDDAPVSPTAEPIRGGGAGVLSSVAAADGWVAVPEDGEGIPAGETVTVERWEYQP